MISMAQRKTQFRSVSSTSCFTATPFDSNTWLLSSCDALICVPSAEESASYNNSQPPPFGYNSTDSGFISYPPISTSHKPWMTTASNISSHWEHSGSRGERDCDWTSPTSEYNDDERDHYYSREGSYNFEQDYHSRDNSWEREYHHWEQRHRDKEEAGKHKSWCKQHESKECENHKKNKHKKKEKS
ncbi:pre-mRNA 3'-end-processing factor FIP1-like isoform X1 [Podarcis raffonei]|uniref:pre-mRNA 3'-end-processing factor FIP1-like isoform X1 n=1 Tax=Podarcis raffonei TaxID=65483 RepID=UPI0023291E42|nr:pre-mRNA 3'-end-processing factor FIP1-like isoform X1 [Podarcis raffonei]XP_053229297.1 pre-mRNA 3'-end-processing factor FIP1-like isoform X1 [Podarcis raffonei]XP_053229298.1 pre-mRNA 3'-end-processing factor FIP1-like isoform X1 [Podarcis raffonei]XP_053229299.1 pre-mRNA 3'-end-processing factor FIP1-like isoform X1 [Podarcis raffonei]XP_053229300.1 pre-mRNA 3'-end-processing factor FIP1-like isoform X1 [Podarcis raffonei]XP_053229301.1 pre-mRNA 3'-end-processing factor FIP1-like isofor